MATREVAKLGAIGAVGMKLCLRRWVGNGQLWELGLICFGGCPCSSN